MREGIWKPGFIRALLLGGVSFGAVIAAYLLRDSAVQEASQKYQEAKTNLERKTEALDAEHEKKLTDALEALQKSQEQYWTSAEASARGILQAEFDAKLKSETTLLETRRGLFESREKELEAKMEEVNKKHFFPIETITKLPCTTTLPASDIWISFIRVGFLDAYEATKNQETVIYDRVHNDTHLIAYAYRKYTSELLVIQQDLQGVLFTARLYMLGEQDANASRIVERAEPLSSFVLSDGNTIIVSRYDDKGFVKNISDGKTVYLSYDKDVIELHKQQSLKVLEEFRALYKQDAGFFKESKKPEAEATK